MSIRDFKDLLVWQRSMSLAKKIYSFVDSLPQKEEFALKNQLRRSAVSIPSNLAEGSKRGSRNDFLHFVKMANGSLAEAETQVLLAKDIYSVDAAEVLSEMTEVSKMMNGLISSLSTNH